MALGEDIITSSSGVSEYVSAWLDQYTRSHGLPVLNQEQERSAVHELCEHLYENLTILDSKSSALIGSNALTTALLAAISLITPQPGMLNVGNYVGVVSFALLLPSLIALVLNVTVISVYWSTIKELTGQTGIADRARSLVRLRSERTRRYRIAFTLHMVVLMIALLGVGVILLKQIPI